MGLNPTGIDDVGLFRHSLKENRIQYGVEMKQVEFQRDGKKTRSIKTFKSSMKQGYPGELFHKNKNTSQFSLS